MKLYGYRNGRTLRALWALEEVQAEYEYVEVDVLHGEGRAVWFLALNPAGKVPVLVDGSLVLSESAAICMHLADRFPAHGLLPAPGTPARSRCYQWISFVVTELDAALWTIAKHRFALPREHRVPEVVATAAWEFERQAAVLDGALRDREYLCDTFTVADILAVHVLLWAESARIALPATLVPYVHRLTQREAYRRAQQAAAAKPAGKTTPLPRPA